MKEKTALLSLFMPEILLYLKLLPQGLGIMMQSPVTSNFLRNNYHIQHHKTLCTVHIPFPKVYALFENYVDLEHCLETRKVFSVQYKSMHTY